MLSACPTTIVDVPSRGKVASIPGDSVRGRESRPPSPRKSAGGLGCRSRNSRSGVMSSTAKGAVLQPFQTSSPSSAANRAASAKRISSVFGREGFSSAAIFCRGRRARVASKAILGDNLMGEGAGEFRCLRDGVTQRASGFENRKPRHRAIRKQSLRPDGGPRLIRRLRIAAGRVLPRSDWRPRSVMGRIDLTARPAICARRPPNHPSGRQKRSDSRSISSSDFRNSSNVRRIWSGARAFCSELRRFSSDARAVSSGARPKSSGVRTLCSELRRIRSGARAFSSGVRRIWSGARRISSELGAFCEVRGGRESSLNWIGPSSFWSVWTTGPQGGSRRRKSASRTPPSKTQPDRAPLKLLDHRGKSLPAAAGGPSSPPG